MKNKVIKTLYVYGDSYFQHNGQYGWTNQFIERFPHYEMINRASGGASLDWIEDQIALRSPPKPYNNIGIVALTHPRRLWITPVHLNTACHGNCSHQLREITKYRRHAPEAQAQLDYLKKNKLEKSYQHVYDLLADDEQRWVRDVRKTISSINQLACNYEKFFVFFSFTDTLKYYRKLANKSFSNLTIVDGFCFDNLFDNNDLDERERYRNLANHMSPDENLGFCVTLANALDSGKFNYNKLHKYWRKNVYYSTNRE